MADPLITNDQVRLWKELAVSRRTYTLSNAISGGATTAYASFKVNGCLNTVEFYLCRLKFLIPLAIARECTLTSSPTVNVDYEIAKGRRPQSYARRAFDTDDGCRVGISVWKDCGSAKKQFWLIKDHNLALPTANSLFDWFQGRITDPETHIWPHDRIPFIGPLSSTVPSGSRAFRVDANGRPVNMSWNFRTL